MTAEALASELGGGPYGRGYRGHCPSHDDHNPSLDLVERNGRTLMICRAGCDQRDVIDALVRRGLWSKASSEPASPSTPSLRDLIGDAPLAAPSECCLKPPRCRHWIEFDQQYLLAHLFANLEEAAQEVATLYATAQMRLDVATLTRELNFALSFDAICPTEIDDDKVIARAVALVAWETLEAQR
jgi:hypothetical protein